jgi:hypothetical protein
MTVQLAGAFAAAPKQGRGRRSRGLTANAGFDWLLHRA